MFISELIEEKEQVDKNVDLGREEEWSLIRQK
jgi:hypothetical protein